LLIPQLTGWGTHGKCMAAAWFSTCTFRPHCAWHFELTLSGHWTGRGSPTSPIPLSWPPHSSNLTTSYNSLWGIIKGQGVAHCYCNSDKLRKAVEQEVTTIKPHVTQKMAVHQAVFRTRRFTYRSTWCTVTLATCSVK
jgi:hypothetical protein